MAFKRKFWKRGDRLNAKELNRIEDYLASLNLNFQGVNGIGMSTLVNNSDFNTLDNKTMICPISTDLTYINGPTEEHFSGVLIQVCYNPGESRFQIVFKEKGPIYTRVYTKTGGWRAWNSLTEALSD